MSDTTERPAEEVETQPAAAAAPAPEAAPEAEPPPSAAAEIEPATEPEPASDAAAAAEPAKPNRAPEPTPAETGAALASLFPALFGGPGPKPVKLRIQADIQARAPGRFTKKALSIFLHRHTTSTGYLKALVAEGATRIDLDGAPAGEIDPVHLEAARVELARRWDIVLAKRAAERAAARASGPRPGAPVVGDGPAGPGADPRPPRTDRPPRRPDAGRPPRPPRDDSAPRPPRPESGARPPRDHRGPRPDRPPHPGPQALRPQAGPAERRGPPAETALPTDPAQRERLMLLRAFEASPLKKANFCALKRISEAELDQQLALARQELAARKA
jgi:sRNA-binding protein